MGPEDHAFSTEDDAAAFAMIACLNGAVRDSDNDTVDLIKAISSSTGTLPSLEDADSLDWDGATLAIAVASLTFTSAADAPRFAAALAAARMLSDGISASLSDSGSTITILVTAP